MPSNKLMAWAVVGALLAPAPVPALAENPVFGRAGRKVLAAPVSLPTESPAGASLHCRNCPGAITITDHAAVVPTKPSNSGFGAEPRFRSEDVEVRLG